jgi:hypothetical protein
MKEKGSSVAAGAVSIRRMSPMQLKRESLLALEREDKKPQFIAST